MKERANLKVAVYDKIMEDIFSNNFDTEQVLTEKMLIERYGYSKSPIREALVMLCNDGVLRSIPRYGYEIIRISTEDIREMLQFRFVLERFAIMHYCSNITEQQLKSLRQIDNACNKTDSDMWQHWENNTRFHSKLLSFSNNKYMCQTFQNCMDCLKRAYAQFYWNKWTENIPLDTKNHEPIICAIESGDLDLAITKLRDDLNDFAGITYWLHTELT